ncbi:MAG: right-handed parallel beta-helix repeat-containing protein, partial [Candidatus Moranbacteria bacterium]|nr:right-handed parallel beta-helix repeat-containing protein [Candidatus Moranbacteria bacterium]
MKNKITSIFLAVSFLLTPVFVWADTETYPWQIKYHLRDDSTGGECTEIGTWNQDTKTCTVTQDFHRGVEIESDGITLDGNDHKISSDIFGKEYLILVHEKSGVTIKNLNLEKVGIQLYRSSNNVIENITLYDSNYGIYVVSGCENNIIKNNKITKTQSGIVLIFSSNNQIIGNEINQNKDYFTSAFGNSGMYIAYSHGNLIKRNVIQDIKNRGIWLNTSNSNIIKENTIKNTQSGVGVYEISGLYNEVFNNDFIDNKPYQMMSNGALHLAQPLPIGGNYWDDYDSEEEGCFDVNGNGICDEPYKDWAGRNMDQYPHKKPFNWEKSGNSNILFIPGIQASRLYKMHSHDEDQLWEPTNHNEDVKDLYLDENGNSIKTGIYTRDVIDEAYGFNIYKGFMSFLDDMKEEKTINNWEALPYDWRYSPERVIRDGIAMDDGTLVNPVSKLESLAASADNGKVTIISHSNGGIFAKLLVSELEERGREDLVERIIFVATPQAGTPKALAGLLHGDKL